MAQRQHRSSARESAPAGAKGGRLISQIAKVTDAAILVSFALVNLSLPVIAHRARARDGQRFGLFDPVIPTLALLLSGVLLIHVGWWACVAVLALAAAGVGVYMTTKVRAHPGSPKLL